MQAVININEETMDKLSGSLSLPPLYDEDGIYGDELSYAIKLMVDLCAD